MHLPVDLEHYEPLLENGAFEVELDAELVPGMSGYPLVGIPFPGTDVVGRISPRRAARMFPAQVLGILVGSSPSGGGVVQPVSRPLMSLVQDLLRGDLSKEKLYELLANSDIFLECCKLEVAVWLSPPRETRKQSPFQVMCRLAGQGKVEPSPLLIPSHPWTVDGPEPVLDARTGMELHLRETFVESNSLLMAMIHAGHQLDESHNSKVAHDTFGCKVFRRPELYFHSMDTHPDEFYECNKGVSAVGTTVEAWPIERPSDREERSRIGIGTRLVLHNFRWVLPPPPGHNLQKDVSAHALFITSCHYGEDDVDVLKEASLLEEGSSGWRRRPDDKTEKMALREGVCAKVFAEQGQWYPFKLLGWVVSSEELRTTLKPPDWFWK